MSDQPEWAGSDFQLPPRPDGAVGLCGACRQRGHCRLGLEREELDENGVVHTRLRCPDEYEGGPEVAHGGWTASVFDELLGHVPMLHGQLAVTGTLEVRFVRPVPINRELQARAWVDRREGQRWYIVGELLLASTGAELGRAQGIFVQRDRGHFDRYREWLAEQDAEADDRAAAAEEA